MTYRHPFSTHPYICASWPDSVFTALRTRRKQLATQIQDKTVDGKVVKWLKRRERCCTLLLRHFEVENVVFPVELEDDMLTEMVLATQHWYDEIKARSTEPRATACPDRRRRHTAGA